MACWSLFQSMLGLLCPKIITGGVPRQAYMWNTVPAPSLSVYMPMGMKRVSGGIYGASIPTLMLPVSSTTPQHKSVVPNPAPPSPAGLVNYFQAPMKKHRYSQTQADMGEGILQHSTKRNHCLQSYSIQTQVTPIKCNPIDFNPPLSSHAIIRVNL
ncbi:uncharacterized protein EURHEDRAFT_318624 [Aspergillus ruber CBS 135680]|uniref:Uncharacterized protein n=1 Tax=Aspergillus ruber (strain CBS 135680) TaxID=1388766 RepID=A0A017SJK2_ASPRC|nr:uncharacterized protein EURHEDRAFT_318624 [Aspergillus ruber CBS 135680]EYE97082.1 hypothetical protein EURHEDRAFT_318624 [Aspergillus ruber CBS 135680]